MALQIISVPTVVLGTAVSAAAYDQIFVTSGIILASTASDAIYGAAGGIRVTVSGNVAGASAGIRLGDVLNSFDYTVTITASGVVSGYGNAGVRLSGSSSSVTNAGTMTGAYGLLMGSSVTGSVSTVYNSGTITADNAAILRIAGSTDTLKIINTGEIIAGAGATALNSNGSTGIEILINRGTIVGELVFGDGADIYDGRGGTVDGTIYGGVDADTFSPGMGVEVIDGGDGTDTLDLRSYAGMTIALDGSLAASGETVGDTYISIERVYGSNSGNDVITGDAAANTLYGLNGADAISGGSGADFLSGGRGVDILTGGLGNDRFVFADLRDIGDTITDFGNSATSNDAFSIKASAFGGGLVAGTLLASQFQSRADNVAQDATDRFIFRTTDKSLWFDIDGLGGLGPLMVADLQASAIVVFGDIVLY